MISSPSAQIVNILAEKNFLRNHAGDIVEAYGPVMGIATAIIAIGIAVTTSLGPEKRGRSFDAKPAGMNIDSDSLPEGKDIEAEAGSTYEVDKIPEPTHSEKKEMSV